MDEIKFIHLFYLYIYAPNLLESVGGESARINFTFAYLVLAGLSKLEVSVSISIFQSRLLIKSKNQK